MSKAWTAEEDVVIRRYYNSKGRIWVAETLGRTVDAVAGRSFRINHPKHKTLRSPPPPPPPSQPKKKDPFKTRRKTLITIVDLEDDTCHWPFDGGFYCGKKTGGKVYCKSHDDMAHRKFTLLINQR